MAVRGRFVLRGHMFVIDGGTRLRDAIHCVPLV